MSESENERERTKESHVDNTDNFFIRLESIRRTTIIFYSTVLFELMRRIQFSSVAFIFSKPAIKATNYFRQRRNLVSHHDPESPSPVLCVWRSQLGRARPSAARINTLDADESYSWLYSQASKR